MVFLTVSISSRAGDLRGMVDLFLFLWLQNNFRLFLELAWGGNWIAYNGLFSNKPHWLDLKFNFQSFQSHNRCPVSVVTLKLVEGKLNITSCDIHWHC